MLNNDKFTKLTTNQPKKSKEKCKEQLERSKVNLGNMNRINFIQQVLHHVNVDTAFDRFAKNLGKLL